MKKITILLPAYNEYESIPSTYRSLIETIESIPDYEWELLFVNDGSTDSTESLLLDLRNKDPRVNILSLSRNFGKENAMLAGMDYSTGDALIIMDSDGQDDSSVISEMIKIWESGVDDVYAMRRSRGKESWLRKKLSLAYYSLLQKATNINILPNVGDFRLLDRRCVDALRALPENERNTKCLYCWIGFRKQGIYFNRLDRNTGKSSFSFMKLLKLSIDGFTTFTTAPLRISTVLGFLVSGVAFIYMIFTIVKTFIWGEPVRGYPTLTTAILFLGGVQLISLGIIGEYIGRIFTESKRRPAYFADTFNSEKVAIKLPNDK